VSTTLLQPPRGTLPLQDGSGGGGNNWLLLMVASNEAIAHIAAGRLREEGVETFLDTSNPSPGAWLHPFGDPTAPVRIYVRARDWERARDLLPPSVPDSREEYPTGPLTAVMLGIVLAIALMLVVVEIFEFAPCVLRLFCF